MELENWRLKLLDIGKKNRLICYKDNHLSSITILLPDIDKTYKLVSSGQKISLYPIDIEKKDDKKNKNLNVDYNLISKYQNIIKSRQLLLSSIDLNTSKILSSLDRKAKNFIIDKGINVLYVTFAMLTWDSKDLKERFTSPLIMVPIKLNLKDKVSGFSLEQYEDEIIVNPTLRYKLLDEYNITLPEFTEDMVITDYLNKVESLVNGLGWLVSPEIKIGLFSFLKMNMYVDLKDNEKIIMRNPHILNLFNKSVLPSPKSSDGLSVHNVVDADSSQIEAIKDAKAGNSFVLQGPPGTGKSQTITNIIAESLYDGKKVLFVSEKVAALNIVYHNLVQAGLGDFCLELHSYKANKKDVIEELYRTLTTKPSSITSKAKDELTKLKEYQTSLDDYVQALKNKITTLEMSPYEVFNELGKYEDIPTIDYHIKNINLYTKSLFDKHLDYLDSYLSYVNDIGYDYHQNPWFGFDNDDLKHDDKKNISEIIWKVINFYRLMLTNIDEINDYFHYQIKSLDDFLKFIENLQFITKSKYRLLFTTNEKEQKEKIIQYNTWKASADQIKSLMSSMESIFNPQIYGINGSDLLALYNNEYKSVFRIFNKDYKKYQKLLNSFVLGKKLSYKKIIPYLELLKNIQNEQNILQNECLNDLLLINSDNNKAYLFDWQDLINDYTRFINLPLVGIKNQDIVSSQILNGQQNKFEEFVENAFANYNKYQEDIDFLKTKYNNKIIDFDKTDINKIINQLSLCLQNIDLLDSWSSFNKFFKTISEDNILLNKYIDVCIENEIDLSLYNKIYQKIYYKTWANYIIDNDEIFLKLNRNMHDKLLTNYVKKDFLQFEISKAQIIDRLSNERPNLDMVGTGSPSSIILREHQKKRNLLPVRLLLNDIGDLVLTLKPCFLMSPLSVSTYLDPSIIHFDLVIFDEASQIFPWDSIGSIYRANQVIIVGDSKQMPPTNFFNTTSGETLAEEERDTEENVNDFESILDLCTFKYRNHSLEWHYRSRSEQLIAFSNKNYYENRLVTFPSTYDGSGEFGVKYEYLDNGIFDRATKTNMIEAKYIVQKIKEQLTIYPDMSLGVVTFNQNQQDLIDSLLDEEIKNDPSLSLKLEKNEDEKFFIKNLETVQGDERDTIIFSVCYAKDENGKFYHNFGPLNRIGGERRLNVAVTRAKYQMIVVSSIDYLDIDLNKTQAEGARLLKEYLKYVKDNNQVKMSCSDDYSRNEFIILVKSFLENNGYLVVGNVGSSNYKIDLVIKNKETNKSIIAIECDGINYQESNTRDRDRLRKQVFERMGWAYYRIWSPDWIKNETLEGKKLITFIENVIKKQPKNDNEKEKIDEQLDIKTTSFITDTKPKEMFTTYENSDIVKLLNRYNNDHSQSKLIKDIIMKEAPISIDYLMKKILPIYNRVKITNVVKEEFQKVFNNINIPDMYVYQGFIYLSKNSLYPLRVPKDKNNIRDVSDICIEELSSGMLEIVKTNQSMDKNALFKILSQQLGFSRLTDKIEYYLNLSVKYLLKLNFIKEQENIISINK